MELQELAGVGKSRAEDFKEESIFSAEDLVKFLPYKYYDFSKTEPFAEDGRVRLLFATVIEGAKIVRARKNLSFVTCRCTDQVGHNFTALWFNQSYVKSQLFLGEELYLYGKNSPSKKNTFIVTLFKKTDKLKQFGFLPIYKKIGNIGQSTMQAIMTDALNKVQINSDIPAFLAQKYGLLDINQAYRLIHQPLEQSDILRGGERVEVEELLPLLAVSEYRKKTFRAQKPQRYLDLELAEYASLLPYTLTESQASAALEIQRDMRSPLSMNRLLQGDVGSGKTAVAFFGCYLALKSGLQSAFVCPTEILARQQYESAKRIFSNINITNVEGKIVLLTGSMTAVEKRVNYEKIANGEALIVFGTQAVLSGFCQFKNLSFVVIDEQHRFGVRERRALADKGAAPDILVMSATPIPRSMNLVVYGDLDISRLSKRPAPFSVTTNIVSEQRQEDMWNYINLQTKQGSKAYVVCARIDEEVEDESAINFSANNMYKFLREKFGEGVGLIHGSLAKKTQETIIEKFRRGEIRILVATSIVEVGVDVPDADIMVIASPNRFGLATLHQLRGRVGRNGQQAFCFCLGSQLDAKSIQRIKFFKEHSDGFEIADYDLSSRGAGDIFGTAQHGSGDFPIKNFSSSGLKLALEILEQVKNYPELFAHIIELGEEKFSKFSAKNVIFN